MWRAGATLVALGALTGAFYGCGPSTPDAGAPGQPPWLREPLAASAPSASAEAVEALPATVVDPNAPRFDPEAITPLLEDPALAEVKARVAREAFKGAADKLAALIKKLPDGAPQEAAWSHQLGILRRRAGEAAAAVRAFDRSAASGWVLSDHARLEAAELLVAMDEPGEALARLSAIGADTALGEDVALVSARAHAARRDVDKAAAIWRLYLAKEPRPRGWQNVALDFARALLNQPSLAHAEEAAVVARMVIYESPGGRGVGEARELERRALATLPSDRRGPFEDPPAAERAAHARALADSGQGREAIAAADQLIASLEKQGLAQKPSEVSCEAHLARCKGLGAVRRYAEASDACAVASARCEGHPRQVVALFLGGRYGLRGGQLAAARQRYAELERKFPDHSFADDARLHGAEAARELGDLAAFTRMLSRIDEDYPQGDMVEQALFALALASLEEDNWAGAVGPLERSARRRLEGRPYWADGRALYFLGRARIELGQTEEGLAALERVIREHPVSYYMVHAYARLAHHDEARARRVLDAALAAEPEGSFVIPDHPELHRPAFLRAVELVRQGEGKRALAELDSLGVRQKSAHPALSWASAFLLARIDAPAESHGVLRGGGLWEEHYPAGIWRSVWEVAYPRPFADIVARERKRSPIAEHLAYAIMREESAFDARVVSHADAYGLMQLIVPTARSVGRSLGLLATAESLKQPAVNIALGCRFLSQLANKFDQNPLLAIPGYNAGPGAPRRWLDERPAEDFDLWVERIPYFETRRYTKRVIRSMAAYAMLYGEGMDAPLMRMPLLVQPAP